MAESNLPPSFRFSQASLQDYADCPRRFQLRYILETRWPAAHDEPAIERERRMQRGAEFHDLIHQHTLGLPVEVLSAIASARTSAGQNDLRRWWDAYLTAPPPDLPTTLRQAEVRLSTPFRAYHLFARYDLLAIDPEKKAVIVDWKTGQTRPKRAWLAERWQTLVYRYVLVEAGTQLNGGVPIVPGQIEMIYWFANFPGQIERFSYDDDEHTTTENVLRALIAEIAAQDRETWPLTDEIRRCQYCAYRTLCDREKISEGERIEGEAETEPFDFDLDLEQIAEIEF